jgi:hypothetical protein
MVCFLLKDLLYKMLLPRLIIIFLFAGVILKSTHTPASQFHSDSDAITFLEDDTDEQNDENIYLFRMNLDFNIVSATDLDLSVKTIDRPPYTETPPPEFV